MNIAWSPEAIEDLASLRAYIAEDNPAAARRVVLDIIQSSNYSPTIPRSAGPGAYRAPANLSFQGHPIYRPLSDPAHYHPDLTRLSWGTALA
jgi:toxin ParE1/3/4